MLGAVPPLVGALAFLAVAAACLRGRRTAPRVLLAALCVVGACLNADVLLLSLVVDEGLALRISRADHLLLVFGIPLYLHFVHAFLGLRRRWPVALAYLVSLAMLPFVHSPAYMRGMHRYRFGLFAKAGPLLYLHCALSFSAQLYCLWLVWQRMRREGDPVERNKAAYVVLGLTLSVFLVSLDLLPLSGVELYPPSNFSFLPMLLLAYGVTRYDLLDMGLLLRRSLLYGLLGALSLGCFALLLAALGGPLGDPLSGRQLLLCLGCALPLVFCSLPLRTRLQAVVDRWVLRGRYDYARTLEEFSQLMSSLRDGERVRRELCAAVREAMDVQEVRVLEPAELDPALAERLQGPLTEARLREAGQEGLAARLRSMGASALVPLRLRGELLGVLCLGPRRGLALYGAEDLRVLQALASQAAICLENARAYEDLEERVRERTRALEEALREKERTQQELVRSESLAAIGRLAAGVAHELNNPLASSLGLLELALEGMDRASPLARDLELARRDLRRAAGIVASLLEASRQSASYEEEVDLRRACHDAVQLLYSRYKRLPVEVVERYEQVPPVRGNFGQLCQLCINLLSNAVESLPDGRGRVTVRTYRRDDRVVLECRDTGCGIRPEIRERIFEPFFTTKPPGQGTGLGLYICHEIARRHGGWISVESRPGQGSTFIVSLPASGGRA